MRTVRLSDRGPADDQMDQHDRDQADEWSVLAPVRGERRVADVKVADVSRESSTDSLAARIARTRPYLPSTSEVLYAPVQSRVKPHAHAQAQVHTQVHTQVQAQVQAPRPRGAHASYAERAPNLQAPFPQAPFPEAPFPEARAPLNAPATSHGSDIDRNLQAALVAFEQAAARPAPARAEPAHEQSSYVEPPFTDPAPLLTQSLDCAATEVMRLPAAWYVEPKVETRKPLGAVKAGLIGLSLSACVIASVGAYVSGFVGPRGTGMRDATQTATAPASPIASFAASLDAPVAGQHPGQSPVQTVVAQRIEAVSERGVAQSVVPSFGNALGQKSRIVAEPAVLLSEARKAVAAGDIETARLLLAHPASAGSGQSQGDAMLLLGETFDPNVLAALGTRGVVADAQRARALYEEAAARGIPAAADRLRGLN
jgi:hypothetical protein